jgi:hypothetical protein
MPIKQSTSDADAAEDTPTMSAKNAAQPAASEKQKQQENTRGTQKPCKNKELLKPLPTRNQKAIFSYLTSFILILLIKK